MSHCLKCGSILTKTEIDYCNSCFIDGQNIDKLTEEEFNKIKEAIGDLELITLQETGLSHLSGGFAKAKIINYDNDFVHIILTFGVQNDCDDSVYTSQHKIDRNTFEIIKEDEID
jgi:hypothetical protein